MMGERKRLIGLLGALALVVAVTACSDARRYDQAICVLIDVSGTYAEEKAEVVRIIKREILPAMVPGDTLLVIRIDSQSYEKDNVEVLVSLDTRPSHSNAQKLAVSRKLDEFAASNTTSTHTDIEGAMMLGAEYLHELASGSRVMLIFSDMVQDLPAGARRIIAEDEFDGIRVIAMNVTHLSRDDANPQIFRTRLSGWEDRVVAANAVGWRTFLDSTKLPDYLGEIR
jgi:hypothetical protein